VSSFRESILFKHFLSPVVKLLGRRWVLFEVFVAHRVRKRLFEEKPAGGAFGVESAVNVLHSPFVLENSPTIIIRKGLPQGEA
jgi:hypothetical protein